MSVAFKERLVALDALRGLTIAGMILVNNPGSWGFVYPPLEHAAWHGLTPTDLVFPFFLFIGGVSMWFSFGQYGQKPSWELIRKIFWRTVSIYVLYVIMHTWPLIKQNWDYSHFRILGVLPRIALCYFFGSLTVLYLDQKKIWGLSAVILIGYWLIMALGGTGNDVFSLQTNFQRQVDLWILGENHMYKGEGLPFDPEGILSTLPSLVTLLIGYEVGRLIGKRESWGLLLSRFWAYGAVLIVAGLVWHWGFPINKKIWTSSYVLVTGGLGIWFLAFLLWITEVKGWKKMTFPFVVYGTNAIFAFFISGIWVVTILKVKFDLYGKSVSGYEYLFETIFRPLAGDYNGSLLFALAHVLGFWLVLLWMYRKKLFVKL